MRVFLMIFHLLLELTQGYETAPFVKQNNFKYCKHVYKGNCQLCDENYFLFTLPQNHQELGLKAGSRICVQCPYYSINNENNYYCGDCQDNSQQWDKIRICSFDYQTKSTEASVYHKIERSVEQLFYVVVSGLFDVKVYISQFATIPCNGCLSFCVSQNESCFPVSKQYQYDLNNRYIRCTKGFAYSDLLEGCDSCPQNCQLCKITVVRTIDSNGRSITTEEKQCLICNDGFSILTTRDLVDSIETLSQCIACFVGCDTCYFGKNGVDLSQQSWDEYNNILGLQTRDFQKSEEIFYTTLFQTYGIAQRCIVCTSTTQSTYIPDLNRRTCIRCGQSCRRCEYVSYSLSQEANTLLYYIKINQSNTQQYYCIMKIAAESHFTITLGYILIL